MKLLEFSKLLKVDGKSFKLNETQKLLMQSLEKENKKKKLY